MVYRDFAPLDSLNQSAGRCNREGKREMGEFFVVKLIDERERLYASYVYDGVLLAITDEVLQHRSYEEQDILDLVGSYYQKLVEKKSDKDSLDLLQMLYRLRFSASKEQGKINSIEDFVLIEEDLYKQEVFIELDEEAEEVWQKFVAIWEIADLFERKKAFDSIKADFYQYVIAVAVKDNEPPLQNGFYYVSRENLADYYDEESGFILKRDYYVY